MNHYWDSLRSTQSQGRRLDELEATVGLSEGWRLGAHEGGGDISGDGSGGSTHSTTPCLAPARAIVLVSVTNSARRML